MESQFIVISVYYVIETFFNLKIDATKEISDVVNTGVGEYVEIQHGLWSSMNS